MSKNVQVSEITFVLVVNGKKTISSFIRSEKIRDLLQEEGTLGEFLRDLVQVSLDRAT